MKVIPVKTRKVVAGELSLSELLDESLQSLKDGCVVTITSKVVALCENRVVPIGKTEKQALVEAESDYYLPKEVSQYGYSFTIVHNVLVPVAGIDESNGNGNYVLWPRDPQRSANEVRTYLKQRFGLKKVGVVITDSTSRPLHWGTEGVGIRYSGFLPMNDYIGQPDLFGRPFKVSKSNLVDALAAAAVLVMGEGTEQTPIAVIDEVPFVQFQDRDPGQKELDGYYISLLNDDMYAPFLNSMGWRKGSRNKSK